MASVLRSPLLRQSWVVSGILSSIIAQSVVLGYTSCLLVALNSPDSPIKINNDSAAWLASAIGSCCMIGTLASSIVMELYGRRTMFLLAALPGVVGWLMIFSAQDYTILLTGRILTGIGVGFVVVSGPIIIGEYTSPKHRGMFLNLKTASVNLGSTVIHALGSSINWRSLALWALLPYIVSFVITCTWPESPAWLASKKQFNKSKEAFLWLRGYSENSQLELNEMLKAQEKSCQRKMRMIDAVSEFFNKFTRKSFLWPLLISLISVFVIEAAGRHVFPTFATQIITDITGDITQPHYYTLSVDLIITLSTMLSSIIVRIFNRRTLLFSSGILSLSVLLFGCVYIFLVSKGILSEGHPWVAISFFILYFVVVNLGCIPVSMGLQGEIFPLQHRSASISVIGVFTSFILMGFLHVTPYLLDYIKIYGTFTALGCVTALGLLALYILLPETKDRTLQEIEYYFNNGKFRDGVQDEAHLKMVYQEN